MKRLYLTFVLAFLSYSVLAQQHVVTSTADTGAGTLRQAILDLHPGDTIVFSPGLHGDTIFLPDPGRIRIDSGCVIMGPGHDLLTIDGGGNGGIFSIFSDPDLVEISGLKFQNGFGEDGSAILSFAPLRLINCLFENNAGDDDGGAVMTFDPTYFDNCIFRNNTATDDGGAVMIFEPAIFTHCTFTGNSGLKSGGAIMTFDSVLFDYCVFENNSANFQGGAITSFDPMIIRRSLIYNNDASIGGAITNFSSMSIFNSTITSNTAMEGGGIYNYDTLLIQSSTITQNTADTMGGGIATWKLFSISNSIIAGNVATNGGEPDIYRLDTGSYIISGGHNIFGVVDTSLTPLSTDTSGTFGSPVDPLIDVLADNGGPTMTQKLLTGSPAIDGGNSVVATETDQRGYTRVAGVSMDIGSYEWGSGPLAVEDQEANNNVIQLYPNPAIDHLMVVAAFDEPSESTLWVLDINGRIVYHMVFEMRNYLKHNLDVSRFTPGMYLVQIRNKNIGWNTRFVVTK